jgi:hypothetical protein
VVAGNQAASKLPCPAIAFANANYTNKGSWNFERRRMQDKVVFDPFLVAVDTMARPPVLMNPPKEFSFYDGDWVPSRNRIEFRMEAHYFVVRAKTE